MAEDPQTLADLRKQRGLRISDVIEAARRIDPEFPTTHVGYLGIEEHGTRDYWKIHALASVFGVASDHLAQMLKPNTQRRNCSKRLRIPLTAQ